MNTTNGEKKDNSYTIKIASSRIEKQFDALPKKEYQRIRLKILSLASNPRAFGSIKLSDNVFRIRIGNYRVIYSIFDKEKLIIIDKVVKRSESTYK